MAACLGVCQRVMRFQHLSYHTEQFYLDWIERFVHDFSCAASG
jgi:hypothetical protein